MIGVTLEVLDGDYAIARLEPGDPLPGWADGPGFVAITRTATELSVACRAERVPAGVPVDRGWRCLAMPGPFALDTAGILVSVIRPLSEAGIGVFVVSSFDGDHLMVKGTDLTAARRALGAAGHSVG